MLVKILNWYLITVIMSPPRVCCYLTYWLPSRADFWNRLDCRLLVGSRVDSLSKVREKVTTFNGKTHSLNGLPQIVSIQEILTTD